MCMNVYVHVFVYMYTEGRQKTFIILGTDFVGVDFEKGKIIMNFSWHSRGGYGLILMLKALLVL